MKKRRSLVRVLILILLVGYPVSLHANAPSAYGIGSVSSSMGGIFVPGQSGPFDAFYNPAYLIRHKKVSLSVGFFNAQSYFKDISSVMVENKRVGNREAKGDVSTHYSPTRGFNFGLAVPLRKKYRRIALGVSGFIPLQRLVRVSTSEPFVPSYPMYENRTQRMVFYGGLGVELLKDFSLGVGANLYFNSAARTALRLNQAGTPVASFAMDVVPAVSPIAGLHYRKDIFSSGLAWRGKSDYRLKFPIEAETPIPPGGTLPIGFDASSVFFFDPQSVTLDASVALLDRRLTLAGSASWEQWSRYQLPHAKLVTTLGYDFGKYEPQSKFHDILISRVGAEYKFNDRWAMRAGYSYHPTPVPENVGINNLLDANKHVLSGGFGIKLPSLLGVIDVPSRIDLHCQYHQLLSRKVAKTDPIALGAPGFEVGGKVWNYGMTLTTIF